LHKVPELGAICEQFVLLGIRLARLHEGARGQGMRHNPILRTSSDALCNFPGDHQKIGVSC